MGWKNIDGRFRNGLIRFPDGAVITAEVWRDDDGTWRFFVMADGRQWGDARKAETESIAKGRAIMKMQRLEKLYRAGVPPNTKGRA